MSTSDEVPAKERFRALYVATCDRLVRYAARRTKTPEEAADVVAETFSIAWRRLDDLPEGDAAALWLFGTARRVLANQIRKDRNRDRMIESLAYEMSSAMATFRELDSDALVARAALERLSDEDREVLMLVAWEGLESTELATVLGCSVNAARIRLYRARGRLASLLSESDKSAKDLGRLGQVRTQNALSTEVVPEC
jgi:RNA polymerase sigma-70 factor, ECF subfamily